LGQTPRQPSTWHQTDITRTMQQDDKGSFSRTTGLEVISTYHFTLSVARPKCRWEVDRVPQPPGRLVHEMEIEMAVIVGVVVGIHLPSIAQSHSLCEEVNRSSASITDGLMATNQIMKINGNKSRLTERELF
jgi:hypothetical protein